MNNIQAHICRECNSIAVDSKAFDNTLVSSNDFGNDAGSRGTTQTKNGPAVLVDCLKCTSCGHSWSPAKDSKPERLYTKTECETFCKHIVSAYRVRGVLFNANKWITQNIK